MCTVICSPFAKSLSIERRKKRGDSENKKFNDDFVCGQQRIKKTIAYFVAFTMLFANIDEISVYVVPTIVNPPLPLTTH